MSTEAVLGAAIITMLPPEVHHMICGQIGRYGIEVCLFVCLHDFKLGASVAIKMSGAKIRSGKVRGFTVLSAHLPQTIIKGGRTVAKHATPRRTSSLAVLLPCARGIRYGATSMYQGGCAKR